MDREILFRGKRIDNGGWIEGFYYKMSETTYAFMEDYEGHPIPVHHYILFEGMTDWGLPNRMHPVEVDPETVCRYTGLADKNGREIFEGDVIKYHRKLFKIVWVQECAHFASHPMESLSWSPCMNVGTVKAAEVVGNIFDNPELLEGGAE